MNPVSKLTFAVIFLFLQGLLLQQSRSEEPTCTDGDEFVPHPNCSLYYQCSNGIPQVIECPDSLYWNDDLQACDFPFNVPECEGGTRVPTTTTEVIVTSTPTTVSTTSQPPEVLRCGGIVRNSSSIISYKPDSTLEPNERCMWTILSPGSFTFTLLSNGSSLVVTVIRRLNETLTMGSITPNRLNETFIGDADVVVVTAFSSVNASRGFSLSYVSVPFEGDVPKGTHEIHSRLPTLTSHPSDGTDLYEDNDLSTFLFSPNNYGSLQTPYTVTFTPRGNSTEVCPRDLIYAFEFDITGNGTGALLHWSEFKGQCVSTGSWTRQTNEALLIVFRSDFTTQGEGFDLHYT